MLATFDVSKIVNMRRKNFLRYAECLSGHNKLIPLYKELPVGVCPLYYPIIVENREQICRELNMLGIDATAWWAGYHRSLPWAEYPDACFIKNKVLVLPVNQHLEAVHIEFIVKKLLEIAYKPVG